MEESEIEDRKTIIILLFRLRSIMADTIMIQSLSENVKNAVINEVKEINKELQTLREKYKNV